MASRLGDALARVRRLQGPSWTRGLLGALLFAAGVAYAPYLWCSRQADAWYDGDRQLQRSLAEGVATWQDSRLTRLDFHTGSSQFNGEWLFGTYLMAGLGYGQTALQSRE